MSFDEFAIRVENVSKQFQIFEHPRDQLKQFIYPRVQRVFKRQPRQYFKEFWALRDVSLLVRKGESCGIVGLNGSGKSTLLQIITGTLSPTQGTVAIQGRVAALLELGSGFNPEFSGRENIYMLGALLGFDRKEVELRLADIQAFADIGEHFDQPLSTYSSGMQMRVAFAVNTSFEPDILIIDEALAVGDSYFQQKCFHRLEQFKARGGTLLFVSHDANTVKQICDKALLISHGRSLSFGKPRDVIDLYQGLISKKSDMGISEVVIDQNTENDLSLVVEMDPEQPWQKATTTSSNGDASLLDFKMLNINNQAVTVIESEKDLVVQYVVALKKYFDRPAFGLIIRDRVGRSIFETTTYGLRMVEVPIASGKQAVVRFHMNFNLKAGQYSFSVGVANRGYAKSEFEEYSLLMHDVEQIHVIESQSAAAYGGVFNMHPVASVAILENENNA
ncbi:sugar ABC transporter ATP-binding protein [Pseudomonas fluorescens]|uniref:ABC transporter ATP-binding protein n=1 Tax=Pseudomonas fluorescens TaxID=294 RepID=UPI0005EA0286|nr:ABC transporter ATP-binding protein [Pseudomonas fluorescens]KJH87154.1 sugar ABC transporter ATP-binding protein [Pseudomonas fluorescens]